jgi:hypothetical protein
MIIGVDEPYHGKALIAYLDLLGFKNDINQNWYNKENSTLDKYLQFKDSLPIDLDNIVNESIRNDINKEKINYTYLSRTRLISDSIIITHNLPQGTVFGHAFAGFNSFFYTIAQAWWNAVESGFTIRGAITYNDIYIKSDDILGQGLLEAIDLEESNAKTSRIILSSSMNTALEKIIHHIHNNEDIKHLSAPLEKLVIQDIDGYIIFNPFLLSTVYQKDNKQNNLEYLTKQLKTLKNSNDMYIQNKYQPLINILTLQESNIRLEQLGLY